MDFASAGILLLADKVGDVWVIKPNAREIICQATQQWKWYLFVSSACIKAVDAAKPYLTVPQYWALRSPLYKLLRETMLRILPIIVESVFPGGVCQA